MKSLKKRSLVFGIGVLGLLGLNPSLVHAELDTDSPAYLTGSIVSATTKVVTLKLEDGRTTKKIPRTAFPRGTDFYPGRIVTLKVTDEIRLANAPSADAKDLSDAEIVKMIKTMQRANGKNFGKKKGGTSALDFTAPSFDFLGISSAFADRGSSNTTSPGPLACKPTNAVGALLQVVKSSDNKKCTYDGSAACADPTALANAMKATPGAKAFAACSPFIYGTGLCAPLSLEGETVADAAQCSSLYAEECKGLDDDTCIKVHVLPYAKSHVKDFRVYFARTTYLCKTAEEGSAFAKKYGGLLDLSDPKVCGDLKTLAGLSEKQIDQAAKDYEKNKDDERKIGRCVLANDPLNADLNAKDNHTTRFSTVTGSMCGGQKLCVRDVKCMDKIGDDQKPVPVNQFARCRVENCNSAQACLDDPMAAGSTRLSSIPDGKKPPDAANSAN